MTPPAPDPQHNAEVRLDAVHERALERAMELDRARAARGQTGWVREAVRHELCPGLERCTASWPPFVRVLVISDDVRARRPVAGVVFDPVVSRELDRAIVQLERALDAGDRSAGVSWRRVLRALETGLPG